MYSAISILMFLFSVLVLPWWLFLSMIFIILTTKPKTYELLPALFVFDLYLIWLLKDSLPFFFYWPMTTLFFLLLSSLFQHVHSRIIF